MKRLTRQAVYLFGTAGLVFLASQPAYSGSSWLSTVTTISDQGSTTLMSSSPTSSTSPTSPTSPTSAELATLASVQSNSSTSVFNLTISLEENPTGDDKYPDDPDASDDEQNKFEAKIEEFADAVFQMTNGKHKIGTVTMFRDGDQSSQADVQWIENCPRNEGPRAHPSGFGVNGKRIYFCTNWPGSGSMDTPKGAGFTLAHEWGHYIYGLYDEYKLSTAIPCEATTSCRDSQPVSTDTASVPSIMNNQWNAVSGSQDWLEFSTDGVAPYSTQSDGDNKNAHARVFEENAWTTLTRSTAMNEPRGLPQRTYYSNLLAPTTDLTVNDDESTARSELSIVWAGDQVVELMIDTSGSMSGAPINNAKTAASLLVGQLNVGENAVGVGRFTGSASQVYPITNIPNPDNSVRAAAQSAIGNLSASGGTDIEEAALSALSQVQGFESGARPSVVFLLTDGRSSVNVSNVVNQYTAARVPLITFGFGSGVDASLLQGLANGTGGQYLFSPTTLAQIQQAFLAANAAFSSNTVVSSSTSTVLAGSVDTRALPLDSTLASTSITVTYGLAEADISLRLLDSAGADTGQSFSCSAASEVSCQTQFDVQSIGAGDYSVEITNNSSADKAVSILVSGAPSAFDNYDIAVEVDDVVYPNNLALRAAVSKGATLSGLEVIATITKPDSTEIEIPLLDDGKNSDRIANDGFYSVDLPYDQNGTYTAVVAASNEAGNAQTTFEGLAISVREDGSSVVPTSTSITENFTRVAVVSATVTDFKADDYDDGAGGPTACEPFADDNLDVVGKIDFAGDVDCFFFTPSDTTSDLVVRATSLRENMQPVVRLYDASGTTELLAVDLSSAITDGSGKNDTIPANLLDAAGHIVTVEHADNTATAGGYALSIGVRLASDEDSDGGGPDVPDVGAGPTTPEGFRYVVYSDTTAELFWSRSTAMGAVVGYEITRDGVLVETRNATSYYDDTLTSGVTYTYEIVAVDDKGKRSAPSTVTLTAGGYDIPTGPSVPGGFRHAVYSDSAAELFWNESTDDGSVVGYDIIRNGVLVETRNATSYFDDSLSLGITYTYQIFAVDDEGNRSGSSTVSFMAGGNPTPEGNLNPTVPGGFRQVVYSETAAELFWNRSTDDGVVVGYELTRNGVVVETKNATSYFDDSLSPGVAYVYEIRAVDDQGNKSEISTVGFMTGSNPAPRGNPSTPAGFRHALYSSSAAELFWSRSTDDDGVVVGYEITRNGVIVETRNATSYYDDSLSSGVTYVYEIVAVDDQGNRSPSNMLSFTVD